MMQTSSSSAQPTPEERGSSGVLASAVSHLTPRLWLASASPRRAQLLQTIGVPFTLLPNHAEEAAPTPNDHRNPQGYVEKLARQKAAACEFPTHDADKYLHIVLSADTVVWHDNTILNKPVDEAEARQMLARLVGAQHQVFTGVCLKWLHNEQARFLVEHESTTVRFGARDADWIARYVRSGEPMDKAGAYAAQGLGALLIEGIEGDFWNVVGLPLFRVSRMLERLGVKIENWWDMV